MHPNPGPLSSTPSLLDRLIDLDPTISREPVSAYQQSTTQLKESVCRDLAALFNTRCYSGDVPSHLDELKVSLVDYGIPDLSSVSNSPEGRRSIERILELLIRNYETRVSEPRVSLLTDGEPLNRTLHFRITALLHLYPESEPLALDTEINTGTGRVTVRSPSRD
jgi:type VI secretion system protein ImpF